MGDRYNRFTVFSSLPSQAVQAGLNYQVRQQDGSFISGKGILDAYLSGGMTPIKVDPVWYMSEGPGRYFNPIDVVDVQNLILSNIDRKTKIDLSDIFAERGGVGRVNNYTTDITSEDYLGRSFAFGQTAFRVVGGNLITDGQGGFELNKVQIAPRQDNFDFQPSDKGRVFEWMNQYLYDRLDPSRVGQSVKLIFGPEPGVAIPVGSRKEFNIEGEINRRVDGSPMFRIFGDEYPLVDAPLPPIRPPGLGGDEAELLGFNPKDISLDLSPTHPLYGLLDRTPSYDPSIHSYGAGGGGRDSNMLAGDGFTGGNSTPWSNAPPDYIAAPAIPDSHPYGGGRTWRLTPAF